MESMLSCIDFLDEKIAVLVERECREARFTIPGLVYLVACTLRIEHNSPMLSTNVPFSQTMGNFIKDRIINKREDKRFDSVITLEEENILNPLGAYQVLERLNAAIELFPGSYWSKYMTEWKELRKPLNQLISDFRAAYDIDTIAPLNP